MVCAILLGIGIHFFPYSPRWLGLKGREADCLQSLSQLRRLPPTDNRVQAEFQAIMTEVEFQKKLTELHHPGLSGFKLEIASWLDLFKKKSWRRTAVGTGIAFFQQFSGMLYRHQERSWAKLTLRQFRHQRLHLLRSYPFPLSGSDR